MSRKIVFLLIDGIGDVALPQLMHMTPLQIARTPVMDTVAGAKNDYLNSAFDLALISNAVFVQHAE